jgi:hypothetical protein
MNWKGQRTLFIDNSRNIRTLTGNESERVTVLKKAQKKIISQSEENKCM